MVQSIWCWIWKPLLICDFQPTVSLILKGNFTGPEDYKFENGKQKTKQTLIIELADYKTLVPVITVMGHFGRQWKPILYRLNVPHLPQHIELSSWHKCSNFSFCFFAFWGSFLQSFKGSAIWGQLGSSSCWGRLHDMTESSKWTTEFKLEDLLLPL